MRQFLNCSLLFVMVGIAEAGQEQPGCCQDKECAAGPAENEPCADCLGNGGTVSCVLGCGCVEYDPFPIEDPTGITGITASCEDPTLCCFAGFGRRNLLKEAEHKFLGVEVEYKEFAESCRDFDYNVFLYVDTHFYGIASPTDGAVAAGCPFFATHNYNFDGERGEKQLLGWNSKDYGESIFPEDSFFIGTFKGSALVEAFEKVDAKNSGPYNIMTNTCATFIVNLAHELGVTMDMAITSFMTRRLLAERGHALVEQIKNSAGYFSFFESRNVDAGKLSDKEIVDNVVKSHTELPE